MEFQHVGKHCAIPSCHQLDFLPFTCHCCNQTFCLQHRDLTSHSCPKSTQGDARAIICPICSKSLHFDSGATTAEALWNRHAATECRQPNPHQVQQKKPVKMCGTKGCGEKLTLTNTCVCKICRKELCLKHRFEDQHECGQAKFQPQPQPQYRPQSQHQYGHQLQSQPQYRPQPPMNNPPVMYRYTNQPLQEQRPQSQSQSQRQGPVQSQSQGQDQADRQVQCQNTVQKKIKNFFGSIGSVFKNPLKTQNTAATEQNPGQNSARNSMQNPLLNNGQNTMQYPGIQQNNNNNCHLREVCQICGSGYATHYELMTHFQSKHVD